MGMWIKGLKEMRVNRPVLPDANVRSEGEVEGGRCYAPNSDKPVPLSLDYGIILYHKKRVHECPEKNTTPKIRRTKQSRQLVDAYILLAFIKFVRDYSGTVQDMKTKYCM